MVYVRLEGDENTGNDSFEQVFTCLGDPDPYVMDFEYCETFGTTMSPWHVSIADTNRTISVENWPIPNTYENWGFMAVDPLQIDNFADEFPSRQGARYGLSMADIDPSAYEGAGVISCTNEAWLISPRLQMPDEGSSVSFLGMSMMGTYDGMDYSDAVNVMVSTRGVMPENFEFVENVRLPAFNPNGSSDPDYPWTRFTVDLSKYNGQQVYVALQGQARNYGIFLDDIRVEKGNVANEGMVAASTVEVSPNPVSDNVALKADCGIERVRIFSLAGMMVYDSGEISTEVFRYNVSGLASGLYIAKIWTPQGMATAKIVVR